MTLAIGKRWCCASIVGVDIDPVLVERARAALARLKVELVPVAFAPAAAPAAASEAPAAAVSKKRRADGSAKPTAAAPPPRPYPVALALQMGLLAPARALVSPAAVFPHNVRFEAADATRAAELFADGSFETIMCLSTSKWVHLNGGDAALMALFAQVYRMLADGGAFVLEPQPWSSYRRKRHVSDASRAHYPQIRLRPERFEEYLIDTVGFRAVEQVRVDYGASVSKGFASRPLFLFIK